jgi:hypothetical protein
MPVIEYKLHAVDSGQALQAPHWVIDGGNWYNPADRTLVGWTPAEADRAYYVPDTITTLTKAELNTRLLGIHAVKKYQKHTGASDPTDPLTYTFEDMTEAEVTTMSNDWYDNYIGGR